MFPPAGSEIHRNEAGEPTGWSAPEDASTYYHDVCGDYHPDGQCPEDDNEDYDADEDPYGYYEDRDSTGREERKEEEVEYNRDNRPGHRTPFG